MKNKGLIIGIVIAIIVGIIIVVFFSNNVSTFFLDNEDEGSISISTKNASKGSGGVGEVTLQEGQKLEVKANLEKESSIKVKVKSSETDSNTENVLDESFKQNEEREFELPSGSYNVFVTVEKPATGNMTINAK